MVRCYDTSRAAQDKPPVPFAELISDELALPGHTSCSSVDHDHGMICSSYTATVYDTLYLVARRSAPVLPGRDVVEDSLRAHL